MSVAEIIEHIKMLSPEERREVASFIRTTEQGDVSPGSNVRYADDQAFDSAVERVFEQHAELFKKLAE